MRLIVTVLLLVISVAPAYAIDVELTSGSMTMSVGTPAPFGDVAIELVGPDFTLTNNLLLSQFDFTGSPYPLAGLYPPGTLLNFSGVATLYPFDGFIYGGVGYRAAEQQIVLTVAHLVPVSLGVVHAPFELVADLHGVTLVGVGETPAEIDVTLTGSGLMTVAFYGDSVERQSPAAVSYVLGVGDAGRSATEIPEPAVVWLLAASALGLTLMSRSALSVVRSASLHRCAAAEPWSAPLCDTPRRCSEVRLSPERSI